jgi:hypothetical protein
VFHASTHRADKADAFVARDEWRFRLDRPITVGRVQVGVTDTGRHELDENATWKNFGHRDFLNPQRFLECVNYRSLHGGHVLLLSSREEIGMLHSRRTDFCTPLGPLSMNGASNHPIHISRIGKLRPALHTSTASTTVTILRFLLDIHVAYVEPGR